MLINRPWNYPVLGNGLCGEIPAEPHLVSFPHTKLEIRLKNVELRISFDAAVHLIA